MNLFCLICILIALAILVTVCIYLARKLEQLETSNYINERNIENRLDDILKLKDSIHKLTLRANKQGRDIYEQSKVICSLRKQIKKLKKRRNEMMNQEVNKIILKRKEGQFGYILPEGKGKPKWTQLRVMKNEETGQEFTVGLADGSLEPIVECGGKYYWMPWQGLCELSEKEGLIGSVDQ